MGSMGIHLTVILQYFAFYKLTNLLIWDGDGTENKHFLD